MKKPWMMIVRFSRPLTLVDVLCIFVISLFRLKGCGSEEG